MEPGQNSGMVSKNGGSDHCHHLIAFFSPDLEMRTPCKFGGQKMSTFFLKY